VTNRVHIDAPAGVIDIEGEKDFVEGLLTKLFPLVEKAGFGSRPTPAVADANGEVNAEGDDGVPEDGSKNDKPRVKRKRGTTPKGHSCADRMLGLKEDGFFKTKRSASEIVTGLGEKGYTHKANQVAAAGGSLFERGLLQRTKEGSGFKYFWDRN